MTRDLSLEFPGFAVGVENAVAKEIAKCMVQSVAFMINVEMGFEDVLNHGGVGGEDLAGAEGAVEGEGGGGGVMEDFGDPLDTTVLIC